jgi:N-acetylglucosamine kinase-like BadF-type ATPase
MPNELLEVYLTDHFAGAAAGSRRMRRLADAERAAEDGSVLERIANEIDEDHTTLLSIIKAEGIEPRWYKAAMSRVVEAVDPR